MYTGGLESKIYGMAFSNYNVGCSIRSCWNKFSIINKLYLSYNCCRSSYKSSIIRSGKTSNKQRINLFLFLISFLFLLFINFGILGGGFIKETLGIFYYFSF